MISFSSNFHTPTSMISERPSHLSHMFVAYSVEQGFSTSHGKGNDGDHISASLLLC